MKRFLKSISLLLAILTVLPILPVFAADTTQSPALVEDGLVARYDAVDNTGSGHAAGAETWVDLAGENDIALTLSDTTYFTDTALHLSAAQFDFPEELLELINGETFTVEMKMGKIESVGSTFTTFVNSKNDNFALFLRAAGDLVEFKNGSNGRPITDGGKDYVEDSTLALTFSLSDRSCVMYIDGHEVGRSAATSAIGATAPSSSVTPKTTRRTPPTTRASAFTPAP